ncbi:MAG: hypothetical protein VKJ24_20815 [Synechococcales bacterium]|nr:hypothetical protein [Synechococcales bacterium]
MTAQLSPLVSPSMFSPTNQTNPNPPGVLTPGSLIKVNRSQIQHCHISLPGEENPVAAIQYQGHYYSFFKVMTNEARLQAIVDRLVEKGNTVVLVKIPTGHSIWVLETDANPSDPTPRTRIKQQLQAIVLLRSETDYQSCQIKVPDLDKPLTGICYQRQYYSLLRIMRNEVQTRELIIRLSQKGNVAIATYSSYGYSIWVLETEAKPI